MRPQGGGCRITALRGFTRPMHACCACWGWHSPPCPVPWRRTVQPAQELWLLAERLGVLAGRA